MTSSAWEDGGVIPDKIENGVPDCKRDAGDDVCDSGAAGSRENVYRRADDGAFWCCDLLPVVNGRFWPITSDVAA